MRARLMALIALLGTLLALGAPAALASAHPIGASAVYVTVGADQIRLEVAVPLDKLAKAGGPRLDGSRASVRASERTLTALVTDSVHLADASGQAYRLEVTDLETQEVNSTQALVARLTAAPPAGRVDGDLTLSYTLLLDRLSDHRAFVFLVSDLQAGQVAEGGPQPLGTLEAGHEQLLIPRGDASWWTGFAAMVGLGAKHIAEGTDHILFLVTLLLVAPLFAASGRWAGRRPTGSALLRTLGIVTSFTVGHTTSLALVSFGLVRFPERPVEVLVAISILVAAVHALRPLTGRGEMLVGGVFGLVHGTAFATAILDLGLDTHATVVAVLGFNVGVELAQLTVVALILPVLILMATRHWYRWVRSGIASFSAVASVCWALAVLTDTQTVLQPLFDLLRSFPLAAYGLFASTAVGAWAATRPVSAASRTAASGPAGSRATIA
jgi:hypothetical protein